MQDAIVSRYEYHHQAVMSPLALFVAAVYQHRSYNVVLSSSQKGNGEQAYSSMIGAMEAPHAVAGLDQLQHTEGLLTDFLSVLEESQDDDAMLFDDATPMAGFSESAVFPTVRLMALLLVRASRHTQSQHKQQSVPMFSPQSMHLSYLQPAEPVSMSKELIEGLTDWLVSVLCRRSAA